MIFMKKRLKLDTERKPVDSEISRMESSVLRSSLQAFMILVLLSYSSGEMPMISWKTRRKCAGLQWQSAAKWSSEKAEAKLFSM